MQKLCYYTWRMYVAYMSKCINSGVQRKSDSKVWDMYWCYINISELINEWLSLDPFTAMCKQREWLHPCTDWCFWLRPVCDCLGSNSGSIVFCFWQKQRWEHNSNSHLWLQVCKKLLFEILCLMLWVLGKWEEFY